ncbi:MAG TPA: peroxiredoxin [Nevskiaceae bacterium]|nr:peroxiredoxin [Nevskiaceae bacterium]
MKLSHAALLLALFASAAYAAVEEGKPAPEFKLQDQTGKTHTLADHKGKWVVLYFYPKDDTPGCTTEACNFRDSVFKLRDAGADVLGVSLDDVKSHQAFAQKFQLPFPLLADTTRETAKAYGVLTSHLGFEYAKRETFLIAPDGIVVRHWVGVDPKVHAPEVLAELQRQQK